MHINAAALYIIMGVYTLLKRVVLPKVWRKFHTPSSRSDCVGDKNLRGYISRVVLTLPCRI